MTTTRTHVQTLIEEEREHVYQVRQAIFVIMHNLIYLDTREMDLEQIRAKVNEFVTYAHGADVARIAADRVIDCLMFS